MTNLYRAMCAELLLFSEEAGEICMNESLWPKSDPTCTLQQRARALLAQPVAEGPSDEEARELADDLGITRGFFDHECGLHISCADLEPFARAVLARWGRPTPQPVAISERLPGPKDVNEDGEVWIIEEGYSYVLGDTGDYDWEPHRIVLRSIGEFDAKNGRIWLPANALPTPRGHQ